MQELLQTTDRGLYCAAGDFYIDPQRPVDRAVVTHAHSDHARWGCRRYLAVSESEHLLRMRMSSDAEFQFLRYGESVTIGGVNLRFHPAGHMLGSAQVRLEYRGKVAVAMGDHKLGRDPTCKSWEPVKCHLLVTESTFGLPVYRWQPEQVTTDVINQWWRESRDDGKCSVLYGYAVGKSQRLLAGLDPSIGPIFTHGAVEKGTEAYRKTGVDLPNTTYVGSVTGKRDWSGAMVVAVPSAHGSTWMRKFGRISTAMASGWMAVRGARRRRSVDRGFVVSDHVDWPTLIEAVEACDPDTLWVTHGYSAVVARYFQERGRDAHVVNSPVRGEAEADAAADQDSGDEQASDDQSTGGTES
ncbi:Metallo-beta-lactamase superfamily protein [Novipirellula galeiformis]|uniref:Metallo-beta-lactamase superfamily protein n=1 Tax=Novipirellula galeiformis TaxID=2528004 RepID=A0A5C6CQW9_9BACT|nr:ligase-associated DNA damage response exonuclease [Novipirellula galeiformis]TWU26295.1 Metallo-beta-lactamase superfamily protein [Novipirellula galeiformis]